jgi:hypothetical protein
LVLELGPLQPLFQNGSGLSTELGVLSYDRYLPHGQETRAAEADHLERLRDRQQRSLAGRGRGSLIIVPNTNKAVLLPLYSSRRRPLSLKLMNRLDGIHQTRLTRSFGM